MPIGRARQLPPVLPALLATCILMPVLIKETLLLSAAQKTEKRDLDILQ